MGPTVWEEEGPMPMRMRSKTLRGRGARSAGSAPAMRAAGVVSSRAVGTRASSASTAMPTALLTAPGPVRSGSREGGVADPAVGGSTAMSRIVIPP